MDSFSNCGSYLTTTRANGSLLTIIVIIEAAAESCSKLKIALVCLEQIAYSKLGGDIQLLQHHLMTEHIWCL